MAYSLALGTIAFFLAVIWGRPLIMVLKRYGMGKKIRLEGPSSHIVKMGTPTMGGVMILIPVILITLALNVANLLGRTYIGRSVLVPVGVMFTFGLLGMIDDLEGIRGKRAQGEGLSARQKFALQLVLAFFTALALHFGLGLQSIAIPTVPQKIPLGLW